MGCFSFICKESGKAVHSDSFNGDAVHLFLLYNGEVIEEMFGNYDSYGHVFDGNGNSFDWKMDWGDVCDLMFDDNQGNGIAAILDNCYKGGTPFTISDHDPNQGWSEDGYYMGGRGLWDKVPAPYHTIYKSVIR